MERGDGSFTGGGMIVFISGGKPSALNPPQLDNCFQESGTLLFCEQVLKIDVNIPGCVALRDLYVMPSMPLALWLGMRSIRETSWLRLENSFVPLWYWERIIN